jgi:hypothetical protein
MDMCEFCEKHFYSGEYLSAQNLFSPRSEMTLKTKES